MGKITRIKAALERLYLKGLPRSPQGTLICIKTVGGCREQSAPLVTGCPRCGSPLFFWPLASFQLALLHTYLFKASTVWLPASQAQVGIYWQTAKS